MMDEDFDIREEQLSSSEKEFENALRPLAFNDFSGQEQAYKLPELAGAKLLAESVADSSQGSLRPYEAVIYIKETGEHL